MNDWQYIGDISLTYGGTFIRDEGHYFDFVEVTDLASACGANGLVEVQSGSTSHESRTREEITTALKSCGPGDDFRSAYKLGQTNRQTSRLMVADALWNYGHKDIDTAVVLVHDSPYTDHCAHCDEEITWEEDDDGYPRWVHRDSLEYDEDDYATCADEPTKTAEPKTPVNYENGAESWPDLLANNWQQYADGETGIRRYLMDVHGIKSAKNDRG